MRASGINFADYFAITSRALPGRHTLGDLGKRPAEAINFVTSITSWVSGRNRARAGSLTRVLQATQILILIYGCLDGCLRRGVPGGNPGRNRRNEVSPLRATFPLVTALRRDLTPFEVSGK